VCQCNEGYERDDEFGVCRGKCSPSCIKGGCAGSNQCICFDGYKLRRGSKHECISVDDYTDCGSGYELVGDNCMPICSPSCVNSKCIAPNRCECNRGYKFRSGSQFECILDDPTPFCSPKCKNGICTNRNQCICYPGYTHTYESSHDCVPDNEPICEPSCVYGKCVGRNKCECNEGYLLDQHEENVCIPACKFSEYCANGTCRYPATCTCNPGFRFSNRDRNSCEPDHDIQHQPGSTFGKVYLKPLSQNMTVKISVQTWKNSKNSKEILH